ncbi:hypothetical protein CerSpe_216930 [Prunus speciosa]
MKTEVVTFLLVNLASSMQRADESLLPGVYKEVGATLHTDPTGLGSLTLFRSIVQSACYPLAAYLAMRHNRGHVTMSLLLVPFSGLLPPSLLVFHPLSFRVTLRSI